MWQGNSTDLEQAIAQLLRDADQLRSGNVGIGQMTIMWAGGDGLEDKVARWVGKAKELASRLDVESVSVTVGTPFTLSLTVTVKVGSKTAGPMP